LENRKKIFVAAISLSLLMFFSLFAYHYSRYIENQSLHLALAAFFGLTYFLSISFGPLALYLFGSHLQIKKSWLLFCCLLTPFLWMTKEVLKLTESHPLLECLYWYVNPLHLWMFTFFGVQWGLGRFIINHLALKNGGPSRFTKLQSLGLALFSLTLGVALYAWGQGENIYALYLEIYRTLY
jgi:uncharacterized membrane protein YfcA